MEDGNLKVGEFVRFEQVLCKIDEIEDNYISFDREFYDHWNDETMSMNYNRFINDYKPRHNKNIIELLEPGDYVNGWKITTIDKKQLVRFVCVMPEDIMRRIDVAIQTSLSLPTEDFYSSK